MRGKHRKAGRLGTVARWTAGTMAAGAVLTAAGMALGAPAHAGTMPRAGARTCHAFARWQARTADGASYLPWQVQRMETLAQKADDALRADVFILWWDAPLITTATTPGAQYRDLRVIHADARQVAYDCRG